jgi:alpha-glucan,water dikinase
MHRHHVKEQAGHFLEQWHQKLHNNATPDDIAIARAYIAFLRSDGDLEVFHRVLAKHGLSRERLASYDRPIAVSPEFYPGLKSGLIADFERYLKLLQSVHSSTDLTSAVAATRHALSGEVLSRLDELVHDAAKRPSEVPEAELQTEADVAADTDTAPAADQQAIPDALTELELTLSARRLLAPRLEQTSEDGLLRDLLYLDAALLEQARLTVERLAAEGIDLRAALTLLDDLVEHLLLTDPSPELEIWWPVRGNDYSRKTGSNPKKPRSMREP